ncbi:MAG: glycine--tRNA ligase [Planctomycetota bacterium]|nr:glycine--tRNA ligase [Planctomycetota bacterium]
MPAASIEQIVNLAKRRGFVYQASEIYGGLGSCWDYGPLGAELKRNVKDAWWRSMVSTRRDVDGLDSAVLQHPDVWRASGHVDTFSDPLVDCRKCKARFRADDLDGATCPIRHNAALNDACRENFTEPRAFNLMFQTHLGPVEGSASVAYLRPETAQGIFTNFLNVMTTSRRKPPFGIAQIGKSFRNEITPGNFIFRTREFEQMEMEYFVPEADWETWYAYWREARMKWYVDLGIDPSNLRYRDHDAEELAHYAKATADIEYKLPIGWKELEGVACRSDFDLKRHAEASGKTIEYFDGQTRERYVPWVIEPAAGVDRAVLCFLMDAYEEQDVEGDVRTVLHLDRRLAPVKVAVFPLVKKDGMPELSMEIEDSLRARGIATAYDQSGAIGRRYRRQDEIGTPWCITVDGETKEHGTVTLRDRDTMEQERVAVADLPALITERLLG